MPYRYAPAVVWLIVAAIAFGIGSWIRGCAMMERSERIEERQKAADAHARDVAWLAQLEGRQPDTPLHRVAEQVRAIVNDAKYGPQTYEEIILLARKTESLDGKLLTRLGPMDRWLPYKTLAHMAGFEIFVGMNGRYDMNQVVFGKRDLSTRLRPPEGIPPRLTFFDGRDPWLWAYLIACGAFVSLWSLFLVLDKEDPLRDVRWRHPAAFLTYVTAAPGTVPATVLYGVGYLVFRFFRDGEGLLGAAKTLGIRFGRLCLRAGYRLRLLRRLPTPALVPMPVAAPRPPDGTLTAPEPRREEEPHGWIVVDPSVTLGRKHRLAARGIAVCPIGLHVPETFTGHAIPEPQIAAFEEALSLKEVERDDQATDIDRVIYREYDYTAGEISIGHLKHEGFREELEEALKEASADFGGADIVFHDAGGHVCEPRIAPENGWNVFAYGASDGPVETARHARLYGTDLGVSLKRLEPSARGAVLRDSEGVPVAQVLGRNVYLLVDLLHLAVERKMPEFAKECLTRALTEAFDLPEAAVSALTDERLRQLLETEKEQHRRNYVEVSLRKFELQKEEISEGIAKIEKRVREAGASITRDLIERKKLEKRSAELENGAWREESERLGREFDALAASKVVAAARAYEDRVEVETTSVRIRHKGNTYLIGRFRIVLQADGRIRIQNIENHGKRRDGDHPHVTDGGACFGNISEAIAKYMAEREYATVIALLHRYLENYNPESPLTKIDNWPIVKE